VVIRALRHFRREIGRPLLVVWDRLNAHRAHRTAAFLARYARDFAVAGMSRPMLSIEGGATECDVRRLAAAGQPNWWAWSWLDAR
jgi:hypothetical protein